MNRALLSLLFAISMILIALPVVADDAGSVIFAKGSVSAEREPPVPLTKRDTVLTEDTVVTGDASRAQLLMLDGAKIAIRPNSRLTIVEYVYESAPSATVTTTNDKSVMSLAKGGFRTITGAFGKDDENAYEVRTPVGVLGIRGTDYSVVFCNGDCIWAPGVTPGASIADGLYLGVNEGRIVFATSTETIELSAGEFAFIPLRTPRPQRLNQPPAVLHDENDHLFDAAGNALATRPADSSATSGFNASLGTRRRPDSSTPRPSDSDPSDSEKEQPQDKGSYAEAPKQQVIAITPDGTPIDITSGSLPPPTDPRAISYSTGPIGAASPIWAATLDNTADEFQLDGSNNLVAFLNLYPGPAVSDVANFDIGTSTTAETGFDSMTVMRWGRWSGGTAAITLSDGTDASQALDAQSLHWISGPAGSPPAMPMTGGATYSLVGSTAPTNNVGDTGTLGNATFIADFLAQRVTSTLNIDIAGSNWQATGNGAIGRAADPQLPAHLFGGNYSVISDGVAGGAGVFSGFFSDPGPSSNPTFPGGAGLTYSLQDARGTSTVSGAAAFGNP
jgi:hypothetical protein